MGLSMTERMWRLVLGVSIIVLLTFEQDRVLVLLIGWLYFEAISNIRLTKLISRMRLGADYIAEMEKQISTVKTDRKINFEAERMLRLAMATVLLIGILPYLLAGSGDSGNPIWFIPWLVGLMLASAGLTNICPMWMVFQWLGFKPRYH